MVVPLVWKVFVITVAKKATVYVLARVSHLIRCIPVITDDTVSSML